MDEALLRVDREGRWYFRGQEIIRREVLEVFWRALERDRDGRYFVHLGGEKEPVQVEDTVFIVTWAELKGDRFVIRLNDGSEEVLDLGSFWISAEGVPYCMVKGGRFPARFLRLPFYQVAQYASFDEQLGEYFIELGDRRFVLGRSEGSIPSDPPSR